MLARQALSQVSHPLVPRLVSILSLIASTDMTSYAGVSGEGLHQVSPV